ncbi:MAG: TatD family hydrolase [Oligoflexus sp.]
MFVDVHTHLSHQHFQDDLNEVIERCQTAGLGAVVVNGLEPASNRFILALAEKHPIIKPALGIYPIEAVNDIVSDLPFDVKKFAIQEEIDWIRQQAADGRCVAIGECGLDGYWVGEETFPQQERVFLQLIEIAVEHDLPLIIHTRKREQRSIEILAHHQVKRVNFHCYGGKTKWALNAAEQHGWYFSIPANARKNEAFTKLLKNLPKELILTETDAPYLAPEKGQRNEPKNVVGTVAYLAELRNWSEKEAQEQVWKNFQQLFPKLFSQQVN